MKKEYKPEGKEPGSAMIGDLTPAQLEALKKKHGSLFLVTVGEGEETEYFFFKKPNMPTLAAATKFIESDPFKSAQIMFNDCLLRGRPEAVEEPETFLAIMPTLTAMQKKKVATIKEL